jgi:hypothetical protein
MPDWRGIIRRRLAGLEIRPVDEIDIVEELAQHVEDRFADLKRCGATDDEALGGSLEELDGETLCAELLDAMAGRGNGQKN